MRVLGIDADRGFIRLVIGADQDVGVLRSGIFCAKNGCEKKQGYAESHLNDILEKLSVLYK